MNYFSSWSKSNILNFTITLAATQYRRKNIRILYLWKYVEIVKISLSRFIKLLIQYFPSYFGYVVSYKELYYDVILNMIDCIRFTKWRMYWFFIVFFFLWFLQIKVWDRKINSLRWWDMNKKSQLFSITKKYFRPIILFIHAIS